MKKYFATYLFILINACATAQSPSWLWAKSAGGSAWDKAYSIASDNTGNVYVTGVYNSASIVFGLDTFTNPTMSSWNMFLVKYDATGNVIWARGATGNDYNFGYSVATDNAGYVYVAGNFQNNSISFGSITLTHQAMFLVKYDSAGNVIWARDAAGIGANAVAVDNLGNIFVGGSLGDTLIFASDTLLPLDYNRFIAKYDSAGNPLWARGMNTFGNSIDVNEPFIAADKYGNVYVTGGFHLNVCTIVTTTLINQGNYNIYLAKFNPSGNLLWAKRYGASGDDEASSVATDTSGNIYITGFFTSTNITFDSFTLSGFGYTAFVVKLDAGGTSVWAEKFGKLDGPSPLKITADNNQSVFVTGYFAAPALVFTPADSLVNIGLFLAKYDDNGNFKWARDAIGGSRATGVTVDATGNPYITGYFSADTLIFDVTVLFNFDNSHSFDIFIASINSSVSVEEINVLSENTFSVFPNPSQGKFFILKDRDDQTTITVHDMMGNKIVNKEISSGLQQIDLSLQPKGIYFVTIASKNNRHSKKVIIQ